MFKIEVNVLGTIKHLYWMNRHDSDFIKFMPKFFTADYGEIITKDDITYYKISEDMQPLLEGKLKQHGDNGLHYALGKIFCKRTDIAKYKVGDKIKLTDYEAEALIRDDKFKDAKEKDKVKVKAPKSKKEDIVIGTDPDTGADITENVDVVTVEATDDLALDVESVELELTGTPLINNYPYDKDGVFLGNK